MIQSKVMRRLLSKNSVLLIALIQFAISSLGQKQDRVWLFADSAGIDFNDLSNPVAISSNISDPCLTNFTSIADNNGELLFYSAAVELSLSAVRVFDKYGSLMENGDSLQGYPWVGQGSMILPMPGDSMKYYLLTGNRTGSMGNNMYYNIIDMSYNGGLGKVISKNNLLLTDYVNEKMNATKHANGRDWWVVLMSTNTDQLFHKFLITPDTIIGPIDQLIGSADNRNKAFGQMIFSKDGSKLVAASSNSSIDVFDFDRCTGDLFNYKVAGEAIYTRPNRYFGCSISSIGNVLYTSSVEYEFKNIYQYDLLASNILASKQMIYNYLDTGVYQDLEMGQHLLGPDDKIYINKTAGFSGNNSDTYETHHVDVILFPDILGTGCSYSSSYFDLGAGRMMQGLPTMVNFNLGPILGSVCDSLSNGIQEGEIGDKSIQLYPNPFNKEVSIRSLYSFGFLLRLYNELGELMYSEKVNGNETIDFSFLPSGNYFIEAIFEKSVLRKKLVKLDK